MQQLRLIAGLILALCVGSASRGQPQPAPSRDTSPEGLFNEAWLVTNNAFYDKNMHGVDWPAVRDELLPKAKAAKSAAETSAVINEALARLKASHTKHYIQTQREYYELLDVFYPDGVPERPGSTIKPGRVSYIGIGLAARMIDGKHFVEDVYTTGPAFKAGVHVGDELVGVEDGPWGDITPFIDREGKPTKLIIRRSGPAAETLTLLVTPDRIEPREMFLNAMTGGAKIIKQAGKSIGYVRVRSYSHTDYNNTLNEVLRTDLAKADALVLDIRGGWGGAQPQYMDVFNPAAPVMTFTARDGTTFTRHGSWKRPAVMLIDSGSRSGKEMLAYAFRKHKLGTLVGERTAGAFLGGTSRPLADGSLLYVAIAYVEVDGTKLEGIGVEPDVKVARSLPYCDGKDPQLEAAVEAASKQLETAERVKRENTSAP